MVAKLSGVQSGTTVSMKKKKKICSPTPFLPQNVQRRLTNVQKSVLHVQSCCFANVNLLVFSFVLSPTSLLKLLLVVIQKCCHHGNVTSHFSSLLCRIDMRPILFLTSLVIIGLPSVSIAILVR